MKENLRLSAGGGGSKLLKRMKTLKGCFGFDHRTMWNRSQIKGLLNHFVLPDLEPVTKIDKIQ